MIAEAERSAIRRITLGDEYFREASRKHRNKLRLEVFTHYGLKCACCGESNFGFLTLDHKDDNGAQQRKELGGSIAIYRWVKAQGFPDGYQTLCYNCNQGRAHYGGVCPHRIKLQVEHQRPAALRTEQRERIICYEK